MRISYEYLPNVVFHHFFWFPISHIFVFLITENVKKCQLLSKMIGLMDACILCNLYAPVSGFMILNKKQTLEEFYRF